MTDTFTPTPIAPQNIGLPGTNRWSANVSSRMSLLSSALPVLGDDPRFLAEMAMMRMPTTDLVANASGIAAARYADQYGKSLRNQPASVQRWVWGNLSDSQRQGITQLGYDPPADSNNPLRDMAGNVVRIGTKPLAGTWNFIYDHTKDVLDPTLRVLMEAGQVPGDMYRAIRTQPAWIQALAAAGAVAAVVGTAGYAGALPFAASGGVSLGTYAAAGLTGGFAAGGIAATLNGDPHYWGRAFQWGDAGEHTWTGATLRRAQGLLESDGGVLDLAMTVAEKLGAGYYTKGVPDPLDVARKVAGQRDSTSHLLGIIAEMATAAGPEGTPSYAEAYRLLEELTRDGAFLDAVRILQAEKISPGRDLARILQLESGPLYTMVSGLGDAAFAVAVDPTMVAVRAGRALRFAEYGVLYAKSSATDDIIQRIVDKAAHPHVQEAWKAASEYLNRGDYSGLARYMPEWGKLVPGMRDWMAKQVANAGSQAATLSWTPGTIQRFFTDAEGLKSLAAGRAVTSSHGYIELPHLGPLRKGMRGVMRWERQVVNLLDDANIEFKITNPDELARLGPEAEAMLAMRLASEKILPSAQLTADIVNRLADLPLPVVRYVFGGWLRDGATLVKTLTTRIPTHPWVALDGAAAVDDVSAFTELFRIAGVSSTNRQIMANALLQPGDAGLRRSLVQSFYRTIGEGIGVNADEAGRRFMDRFVEMADEAYELPGRKNTIIPSKVAHAIAIPDVRTLRAMVKAQSVLNKALNAADLKPFDTFMRYWRPAVLFRIGFIPRAAGDELLSFLAKDGLSSWARSIAALEAEGGVPGRGGGQSDILFGLHWIDATMRSLARIPYVLPTRAATSERGLAFLAGRYGAEGGAEVANLLGRYPRIEDMWTHQLLARYTEGVRSLLRRGLRLPMPESMRKAMASRRALGSEGLLDWVQNGVPGTWRKYAKEYATSAEVRHSLMSQVSAARIIGRTIHMTPEQQRQWLGLLDDLSDEERVHFGLSGWKEMDALTPEGRLWIQTNQVMQNRQDAMTRLFLSEHANVVEPGLERALTDLGIDTDTLLGDILALREESPQLLDVLAYALVADNGDTAVIRHLLDITGKGRGVQTARDMLTLVPDANRMEIIDVLRRALIEEGWTATDPLMARLALVAGSGNHYLTGWLGDYLMHGRTILRFPDEAAWVNHMRGVLGSYAYTDAYLQGEGAVHLTAMSTTSRTGQRVARPIAGNVVRRRYVVVLDRESAAALQASGGLEGAVLFHEGPFTQLPTVYDNPHEARAAAARIAEQTGQPVEKVLIGEHVTPYGSTDWIRQGQLQAGLAPDPVILDESVPITDGIPGVSWQTAMDEHVDDRIEGLRRLYMAHSDRPIDPGPWPSATVRGLPWQPSRTNPGSLDLPADPEVGLPAAHLHEGKGVGVALDPFDQEMQIVIEPDRLLVPQYEQMATGDYTGTFWDPQGQIVAREPIGDTRLALPSPLWVPPGTTATPVFLLPGAKEDWEVVNLDTYADLIDGIWHPQSDALLHQANHQLSDAAVKGGNQAAATRIQGTTLAVSRYGSKEVSGWLTSPMRGSFEDLEARIFEMLDTLRTLPPDMMDRLAGVQRFAPDLAPGERIVYHGGSVAGNTFASGLRSSRKAGDNLFGPALYTTSEYDLAKSYAGRFAWGTANGEPAAVYTLKLDTTGKKWLNLDAPVDEVPEVVDAWFSAYQRFRRTLNEEDITWFDRAFADPASAAWSNFGDELEGTAGSFYENLSGYLLQTGNPHNNEILTAVNQHAWKSGAAGYTHRGGLRIGSKGHDVYVVFDAGDMPLVGIYNEGGTILRQVKPKVVPPTFEPETYRWLAGYEPDRYAPRLFVGDEKEWRYINDVLDRMETESPEVYQLLGLGGYHTMAQDQFDALGDFVGQPIAPDQIRELTERLGDIYSFTRNPASLGAKLADLGLPLEDFQHLFDVSPTQALPFPSHEGIDPVRLKTLQDHLAANRGVRLRVMQSQREALLARTAKPWEPGTPRTLLLRAKDITDQRLDELAQLADDGVRFAVVPDWEMQREGQILLGNPWEANGVVVDMTPLRRLQEAGIPYTLVDMDNGGFRSEVVGSIGSSVYTIPVEDTKMATSAQLVWSGPEADEPMVLLNRGRTAQVEGDLVSGDPARMRAAWHSLPFAEQLGDDMATIELFAREMGRGEGRLADVLVMRAQLEASGLEGTALNERLFREWDLPFGEQVHYVRHSWDQPIDLSVRLNRALDAGGFDRAALGQVGQENYRRFLADAAYLDHINGGAGHEWETIRQLWDRWDLPTPVDANAMGSEIPRMLWPTVSPMRQEQTWLRSGRGMVDGQPTVALSAPRDLQRIAEPDFPRYSWGQVIAAKPEESFFSKGIRYGFDRVIGPAINATVRQPLAFYNYTRSRTDADRMYRAWRAPDLFGSPEHWAVNHGALAAHTEVARAAFDNQGAEQTLAVLHGFRNGPVSKVDQQLRNMVEQLSGGQELFDLTNRPTPWLVQNFEAFYQRIDEVAGHQTTWGPLAEQVRNQLLDPMRAAWDRAGLDPVFQRQIGPGAIHRYLRTVPGGTPDGRIDTAVETWRALRTEYGDDLGEMLRDWREGYRPLPEGMPGWISRTWSGADEEVALWDRIVANDALAAKQAHSVAMERAVQETLPYIDRDNVRPQFQEYARNLVPFWFAEDQFLRRWVRTTVYNPATIRKAQLLMNGLRSMGFVQQDQYGNDMFVYPGSAVLAEVIGSLPFVPDKLPVASALTGQVSYVLPGLDRFGTPNVSPVVSVPMAWVSMVAPEIEPLQTALAGQRGASMSVIRSIVPTSVMRFYDAILADEGDRKMASAMMSAMAVLEANGNGLPDNASVEDQDAYLSRLKSHARIILLAQAIGGFVLPASPQVQIMGRKGKPGQAGGALDWSTLTGLGAVQASLNPAYNDLVRALGVEDGTRAFLERYPDANPADLFDANLAYRTNVGTTRSGAPIPTTRTAWDFYGDHRAFYTDYAMAGPWLLPPAESRQEAQGRDAKVYMEQVEAKLRERRSPREFLRSLKFGIASERYFRTMDGYDQALESADARMRANLQVERKSWQELYLAQHPIFATELASGEGRARRQAVIREMRMALGDSRLPDAWHVPQVKVLMDAFDRYQALRTDLANANTRSARAKKDMLAQDFLDWADRYTMAHPEVATLWDGVLRPEARI